MQWYVLHSINWSPMTTGSLRHSSVAFWLQTSKSVTQIFLAPSDKILGFFPMVRTCLCNDFTQVYNWFNCFVLTYYSTCASKNTCRLNGIEEVSAPLWILSINDSLKLVILLAYKPPCSSVPKMLHKIVTEEGLGSKKYGGHHCNVKKPQSKQTYLWKH